MIFVLEVYWVIYYFAGDLININQIIAESISDYLSEKQDRFVLLLSIIFLGFIQLMRLTLKLDCCLLILKKYILEWMYCIDLCIIVSQNCFVYFLTAMFPSDVVVCYSDILLRILIINIISILDDFFLMRGDHSLNKIYEDRDFILDQGLLFVIALYGDICNK